MKRGIILVFAFCAIAGDFGTVQAAAQRKQFLWRVVNAPAPFYLIGSMHALRRDDYPTDLGEFNRAIDQSQKFIYERDPTVNDQTVLWRKLSAQGTYPHGVTIQQKLSQST